MNKQENRRPLKARSWKFIEHGAEFLGKKNITPNQISLASIGFSAPSALSLLLLPEKEGALLMDFSHYVCPPAPVPRPLQYF